MMRTAKAASRSGDDVNRKLTLRARLPDDKQMNSKLPPSPATSINWDEIHRRLETLRATIEQNLTVESEVRKSILKARAKSLAQRREQREAASETLEIIEFVLAYEKYGFELVYLHEVYPLKDLTPLPCCPAFVLGIINVRGRILSVIDIKKFFNLPEKGLTDLNKVIIIRSEEMELGILADAIIGVRFVPLEEIQSSLPTLTGIRGEYLKGVTIDHLAILDAAKLLSDRKLIVNEEVEE